ncbi:MAG: lysine--tRNA ligase, partial [Candidatus Thorarchaeota archaeon]
EMSKRVFGWSGPVKVPFEWVQLGGRDMGTSKGVIFTPRSWLNISPSELFRYIVLRTDLERTNNIQTDQIPDLVDIYETFERTYYGLDNVDIEKQELAKFLYPLTEAQLVSDEYIPKLSFKFAVVTSQLVDLLGNDVILERCKQVLMKQHNLQEIPEKALALIPKRLERARNWVQMYGSQRNLVEIPDAVPDSILSTLTDIDKQFLSEIITVLRKGNLNDDEIQAAVFEKARLVEMKEKRAFVVLYRILISRKSGPRLGSFLNLLGLDWVADRIESVLI